VYRVSIAEPALKALARLPRDGEARIRAAIDALAAQPRPHGCKALRGRGSELWRVRVGVYRVVYEIRDDMLCIVVVRIGHRREVYRGL